MSRLEKSRAQRILWLLEELKIEYELKTYKRVNMLAPPEFKKVHPLGKAPLVSIQAEGAAEPIVLAESGLIIEYLVDHFGPSLAPQRWQDGKENQVQGETEGWLRYRYLMHYEEGTLIPYLVTGLLLKGGSIGPDIFTARRADALTICSHQHQISVLHQANRKCHQGQC